MVARKKFRYYYWLAIEFIKKNLKLIAMTFLLSFIFIVGFVSLSPYLESFFFTKKQIIGLVGTYSNPSSLPTEITGKVSNGLIFVKPDGIVVPALASTWETQENGKKFLIHLKPNLIWNDGKKFTAYDVDYRFKDVKLKVLDENTLTFELKSSLPIFITYLNKPLIRYPLNGVGGLYRTGKISMKNGVINEVYLLPNKKGIPNIIYKFYGSDDELIVAYKKGEITEFSTSKKALVDQFYQWKNTKIVSSVDYTRLLTLYFNFKNPLLAERDIRSAIRMGINNAKFKDFGQIALTSIPPTSWAYNTQTKPAVYEPETAREIILNNLSASQSANINFYTYYEYSDLADLISDDMKEIGLNPAINYLTQNLPENFDVLLAYWKIPDDPDQYYFWHSSQKSTNISNYTNLKIDKLLEDGRAKFLIKERIQIYKDFQKALNDDPQALFLFYPYLYTVKRK